jgi:hypothetical protein
MAPFVERRYVFTGNGVFVCKTNVGQHTASPSTALGHIDDCGFFGLRSWACTLSEQSLNRAAPGSGFALDLPAPPVPERRSRARPSWC